MLDDTAQEHSIGKRIDNRSDKTVFVDDLYKLLQMASINAGMIEDAFLYGRATKQTSGNLAFSFSLEWINNLNFMANDLHDRAESLWDRRINIDPETEE
jgi:hypothetical protein